MLLLNVTLAGSSPTFLVCCIFILFCFNLRATATATAPAAAVAVAAAGSKSNAVKFQVATYNLVFWLLVPYHNVHVSVCVCESVCVYVLSDSGVGVCIWLGAHCLHFTRAAFPFFTCILWNFSVYILFMPLPKKKKHNNKKKGNNSGSSSGSGSNNSEKCNGSQAPAQAAVICMNAAIKLTTTELRGGGRHIRIAYLNLPCVAFVTCQLPIFHTFLTASGRMRNTKLSPGCCHIISTHIYTYTYICPSVFHHIKSNKNDTIKLTKKKEGKKLCVTKFNCMSFI